MRASLLPLLAALAVLSGGLREAGAQNPRRPLTRLDYLRAVDAERRADLLLSSGKSVEAASWLERAADYRQYSELRFRAVWLYLDAGDYQAAEKAIGALGEERGRDTRIQRALTVIRLLRGEEKVDWSDYRARIRESPRSPEPELVDGSSPKGRVVAAYLLWREVSRTETARNLLESTVRSHPDLPEAHLLLADLHRAQGRQKEADREMAAYVRLDPQAPRAVMESIWRFRALGKTAEAARVLREVLAQNPSSTSVVAELIRIYGSLDQRDEADAGLRDLLVEAFRKPSSGYFAQLNLVIRHFNEREGWEELGRLLEPLHAADPKNPATATALARLRLIQGKPEDALRVLRHESLVAQAFPDLKQLGFLTALAAGDLETARKMASANAEPRTVLAWLEPERVKADLRPEASRLLTYRIYPFHEQRRLASWAVPFDYRAVLAAEEMITRRYPDVPEVLLTRAVRLRDAGSLDEVGELARRVSALRPEWLEPRLLLMDVASLQKDVTGYEEQARYLRDRLPMGVFPAPPPPGARFFFPGRSLEVNHPPAVRQLREIQARMLAGEVEKAIPELQAIRDPQVLPATRWTLGAAYLWLGRWEEAETEWRKAGLRLPLNRETRSFPVPIGVPNFPQFMEAPAPELDGDGSRLRHYPLPFLALEAARASMVPPVTYPPAAERLWELLFRLALKADPRYLPAVFALGHHLHNPHFGDEEARQKEGQELLERVLKERPNDIPTLWAFGRLEEAARRNPDSVAAWQRLTSTQGISRELVTEARRNLLRLQPNDALNRYYLAMLLTHSSPEEALALARQVAAMPSEARFGSSGFIISTSPDGPDTPARAGRALVGVLLWNQGEWARAAAEWQQVVTAPGGFRQRFGSGLHTLSGVAYLAAGDRDAARLSFMAAVRADGSEALPRLFLAWVANSPEERDYHLAAASHRRVPMQDGVGGLNLDLQPALRAILARHPDCFPASYLIARQEVVAPSRGYAGREAMRPVFEEFASRFPVWTGPLEMLADWFGQREAVQPQLAARREREVEILLQASRRWTPPAVEAGTPPGPVVRSTEVQADGADDSQVYVAEGALVRLGGRLEAVDLKSGAPLRSMSLERSAPGVLSGPRVYVAVEGGVVARDWTRDLLVWTAEWNHAARLRPLLSEGRLIVVAEDGAALCLDAGTGKPIWEAAPGSRPKAVVLEEGHVVIAGAGGEVRALRLEDGREAWKSGPIAVGAQEQVLNQVDAVLGTGGRAILAGSAGGRGATLALEARTGKLLWTTAHPDVNAPRLFLLDDRLLVASDYSTAGYLQLDPSTGKEERAPVQVDRMGRLVGVVGPWLVRQEGREWRAVDVRAGKTAWDVTATSQADRLEWVGGRWFSHSSGWIEWRSPE